MADKPENPSRRESGEPGGGQGRTDVPGQTGIWPGSGPWPPESVPIQQPGSFGQGERGAEGYFDSGDSSVEAVQQVLQEQARMERGNMLIRDIMTQGVECVRPDTTLQEAARRMRDLNVGPLPVCGDDDRLAGIVTDRDITVRAVAEGKDARTVRVAEIMTPQIVYCYDDQDATDAAKLMETRQIRRLVVLDRSKRLVGIVSLGDLAVKTRNDELVGEAVEAISEPVHA
jgi:CBS domain-containing protein